MNPVNFSWKWAEDELPIVDQYVRNLGVEISKDCSSDAHVAQAIGKGKIINTRRQVGCAPNRLAPWQLASRAT